MKRGCTTQQNSFGAPQPQPGTMLRRENLAALVETGESIAHLCSLPAATIAIPPLPAGEMFFHLWPVREAPGEGVWTEAAFTSCAPPVFQLRDATLLGSSGLVALGGAVIEETLPHVIPTTGAGSAENPRPAGLRAAPGGFVLEPKRTMRLPGTHIALLAPHAEQPDTALLHTLARLVSLQDRQLMQAESLLLPAGTAFLPDMLGLLDLLPSLSVRMVAPDDRLVVEDLLLPLTLCSGAAYHPILQAFFARLASAVPATREARLPRRIYLVADGDDKFRNQAEMLAALQPIGFAPVCLGSLSLPQQIALMRGVEAVVSSSTQQLAILGFCRSATLVVELLKAESISWRYRRLAALFGLRYDCVLGRNRQISPAHLSAAVGNGLSQGRQAA